MYPTLVRRLWNLGRRANHEIFSLIIQTHLKSSSFKQTQFVNLIHISELRPYGTKTLTRLSDFGFYTQFSFSFSSSSSKGLCGDRMVEPDDGDHDYRSDNDGDDEHEVGGLGIRDEKVSRDVETIVGILHDFWMSGPEAKHKLEQCGVPASSELVVEVLSRIRNDWEAAFTFFLWAGKQSDYSHSVREYHSMISILGKMTKFDTAWALIDEMRGGRTGPSLVTPQTILIMIRKYCAVHDVGKAINTFYALKRFKFEIGIEEFQDLLCALCRYKNVEEAEHLLFCNESTFPFNTKSFNIILNGWSNIVGNLPQAKRFWREMDRRGIARDGISYGSMILCYSRANNLNDVLKLFNRMKDLGVAPDRKVYNAVIYALVKGKLVKEARNLIKTMEEKGLIPDVVTYNSLIKPLCRARRTDEARVVFDEMIQRGFFPSVSTYHPFFRTLRTAEEVFELLEQMKKTKCHPTYDTFIMLIRKFCRWRQLENVFKLWNEMSENGLSPDRSSYIVLVHGLFLNGKLDEAFKYYEEMKKKGFLPEPKTEEMLQAWVSRNQEARPCKLELKDNHVDRGSPNKNTRVTLNTSGYERDFLKKPETRRVTREKGFSFLER